MRAGYSYTRSLSAGRFTVLYETETACDTHTHTQRDRCKLHYYY